MILLLKILGWIVILLIGVPITIYRGVVLAALWLWFLVPLGVKPIGTAQAIGISILLGLYTMGLATKQRDPDDTNPLWLWAIFQQIGMAIGITFAWWLGSFVQGYM